MKIITDHKFKPFRCWEELPEKVKHGKFEYLEEEYKQDHFLSYKGSWYHLSEFVIMDNPSHDFNGWDGYISFNYFYGIVIKISIDGERYMVGRYFS